MAFATRLGKLIAIDDGAYSTEEGGRTDDLGTVQRSVSSSLKVLLHPIASRQRRGWEREVAVEC